MEYDTVHAWPLGECSMWILIGIVLLALWAGGFFAFHVAGFFIHILLILAIASLIIHFIAGPRTAV
jgi:Family of unknown function (DUF5670)